MNHFLCIAESFNEGHPDKLCDIISDAILDAFVAVNPNCEVLCGATCSSNCVIVSGNVTSKTNVDYLKIIRETCHGIGFVSDNVGLDAGKCYKIVNTEMQSPDSAQGVHGCSSKQPKEIGAEVQREIYGYATDETVELMPLNHILATRLSVRLAEVPCAWLRPDGKTAVTVEYRDEGGAMVPIRVHTVIIFTQHDDTVTEGDIACSLRKHIIEPVIPSKYLDEHTKYCFNPSGRFVVGGPSRRAGLSGQHLLAETYGGWVPSGGGPFSGKDPTKAGRCEAYIACQAAKNIVAADLASRCLVKLSYAIGIPEPLRVSLCPFGTGKVSNEELLNIVKEKFDFRPAMICTNLELRKGGNRFIKTAAYGHFCHEDPDFTWEMVKPLWSENLPEAPNLAIMNARYNYALEKLRRSSDGTEDKFLAVKEIIEYFSEIHKMTPDVKEIAVEF